MRGAQRDDSRGIGARLCRILDMNVRESLIDELRRTPSRQKFHFYKVG
jgi:hypothetical protein